MNKSSIFRTAWELFKSHLFTSFSQALKAAWQRAKLIAKMRSGIAYFSFRKANGEVREAIGTLREGNFSYKAKGSQRKSNPAVVAYWDVERNAFRSFRIESLLLVF